MAKCCRHSIMSIFLLVASLGCIFAPRLEQQTSNLNPPVGNSPFMTLKGSGTQKYRCQAAAKRDSSFEALEASANLFSVHEMLQSQENVVGYHYFLSRADGEGGRPTWSTVPSMGDSMSHTPTSTVTGTVIATQSNNGTSISEMLLKATSHSGTGSLSRVSYIQRLDGKPGIPFHSCSAGNRVIEVPYEAKYTFWAQDTSLPSAVSSQLLTPIGHRSVVSYYGEGYQSYRFNGNSWVLLNASAYLSYSPGQQVLGVHYFLPQKDMNGGQPTWELFLPKSRVTGKPVHAVTVDSTSINWVLLEATSHSGDQFMFGTVRYVQRLSTRGGLPPSNNQRTKRRVKKVGDTYNAPYSAIYWFYVAAE